MATTFRTRLVQINQTVFDQIDLFQVDAFTKIPGIVPAGVTLTLMLNNQNVTWPLVDGTSVLDSQVVAGSVYWAVLTNGSYGIRWYPTSLGHWNLAIAYASAPQQIVGIDYDVVNYPLSTDSSLRVCA